MSNMTISMPSRQLQYSHLPILAACCTFPHTLCAKSYVGHTVLESCVQTFSSALPEIAAFVRRPVLMHWVIQNCHLLNNAGLGILSRLSHLLSYLSEMPKNVFG